MVNVTNARGTTYHVSQAVQNCERGILWRQREAAMQISWGKIVRVSTRGQSGRYEAAKISVQ